MVQLITHQQLIDQYNEQIPDALITHINHMLKMEMELFTEHDYVSVYLNPYKLTQPTINKLIARLVVCGYKAEVHTTDGPCMEDVTGNKVYTFQNHKDIYIHIHI